MAGQWRSVAKDAVDRLLVIAKFGCFLHVTTNYLCSSTLVHGPSMLPTLNMTGDVVIAEHVSHRLGKVSRGDLVLVRSPENPRKIVTKRIVGMEGDRVSFFLDFHGDRYRTAVVPKGHVWIQGDNVYASNDSRHLGLCLAALFKEKCFSGYGLLIALDPWVEIEGIIYFRWNSIAYILFAYLDFVFLSL